METIGIDDFNLVGLRFDERQVPIPWFQLCRGAGCCFALTLPGDTWHDNFISQTGRGHQL